MTTDAHSIPGPGSTTAAAFRCPKCNGCEVRRSRRKHDDSLLRTLAFSGYRCRECRARFWRFNGGRFAFVSAAVLLFGTAFVIAVASGLALRDAQDSQPEPAVVQSSVNEPTVASPSEAAAMAMAANPGLNRLADQGDPQAQSNLALAHLSGQGVAKDLALARRWAEKSALQGHPDGQYTLGSMYLAGRGVLQNFQTAFRWFEKAAKQNHAESQYRLGTLYYSGHGVGIDKTKAYVWFNLAAAHGHQKAAEARDRLLPTMTTEQVASAQREAQAWRPSTEKP
jgi:hypothetical protein